MPRTRRNSRTPRAQPSSCACATRDSASALGPLAVAVDPEIKRANLIRLRRIEGQIRGIQEMVEAERLCSDILIQINSAQQALRAVGRALARNHLKYCVAHAVRSGSSANADAMYDELLSLIFTSLG